MAVTPRDRLRKAESLLNSGEEIDHRMAATEAYFAAYGRVKAEFPDKHLFKHGGSHNSLIQSMIKVPEWRGIGHMLNQARIIRVKADYQLDEDFPVSKAKEQIELVKRIFAKLDEMGSAGESAAS